MGLPFVRFATLIALDRPINRVPNNPTASRYFAAAPRALLTGKVHGSLRRNNANYCGMIECMDPAENTNDRRNVGGEVRKHFDGSEVLVASESHVCRVAMMDARGNGLERETEPASMLMSPSSKLKKACVF